MNKNDYEVFVEETKRLLNHIKKQGSMRRQEMFEFYLEVVSESLYRTYRHFDEDLFRKQIGLDEVE